MAIFLYLSMLIWCFIVSNTSSTISRFLNYVRMWLINRIFQIVYVSIQFSLVLWLQCLLLPVYTLIFQRSYLHTPLCISLIKQLWSILKHLRVMDYQYVTNSYAVKQNKMHVACSSRTLFPVIMYFPFLTVGYGFANILTQF